MPPRRVAVALLAVETVAGAAWWLLLLARPDLGSAFLPEGVPADLIRTFVAADLAFYVLLPAAAALGIASERRWATPVLWLHAGGVVYAALWGWGTWAVTGDGLAGAALMTPPAVVVPWLAWRLSR